MSALRAGAAKVNGTTVTRLDGKADPEEVVTEDDVKDSAKLAKMLARVLAAVARLRRAHAPPRIDFEDMTAPAGDYIQLQHNFGGRVRWWVVDWEGSSSDQPTFRKDATLTTTSTLVLRSYVAGTATIRVEAA